MGSQPPTARRCRWVPCLHEHAHCPDARRLRHLCLLLLPIQPVDEYNRRAFANAYNGWANATADMRRGMQRIKDVVCPVCSVLGCTVHCDGNSKLFNWKPRGQPQQWQQQPHSCDFFAADAQRTLDITDAARGVRVSLAVIEHIVLALVVCHM